MKRWLVVLILFASGAGAAEMTTLRYIDQDPGDPPYLTRILVTPAFLRMDSGEDDGDFVLLDRQAKKLFNVMRDSRIAMVFIPGTLPPRPAGLKPRLVTEPPERGNQRFKLVLKGVVCSEGKAARRAAPDAARAMAELKAVLAGTQYRVWKDAPRELQHDCDLANQVWDTGATLTLGLPLEEREFTGRSRQFESEATEPARPELFRIPAGLAVVNAPS